MTAPNLRRHRPQKTSEEYRRIWRLVDGAIRDAIATHPDYFPNRKRIPPMRVSLTKRIVGSVFGWAEQSAQGRSGEGQRLTTGDASKVASPDAIHCDGLVSRANGEAGTIPNHVPAEFGEAA